VKIAFWLCISFVISAAAASAQNPPVHGLWVPNTPNLLDLPSRGEALRNFCRDNHINEVYLSFTSQNGGAAEQQEIEKLINLLHHEHIRVEALLSSKDADEAGKHRDQLLAHVNEVLTYNQHHEHQRFDGIHLHIEPQDRLENQGPGKVAYLPGLLQTYLAVRNLADIHQLTVNADIPLKLLETTPEQRRALMTSVTRLTLMLEGVPADKLSSVAAHSMVLAYQGLDGSNPARMAIGLRASDYEGRLPAMLESVQQALGNNPHYLGWAWPSYEEAGQR
jgi:hypothetical protein